MRWLGRMRCGANHRTGIMWNIFYVKRCNIFRRSPSLWWERSICIYDWLQFIRMLFQTLISCWDKDNADNFRNIPNAIWDWRYANKQHTERNQIEYDELIWNETNLLWNIILCCVQFTFPMSSCFFNQADELRWEYSFWDQKIQSSFFFFTFNECIRFHSAHSAHSIVSVCISGDNDTVGKYCFSSVQSNRILFHRHIS